MDFENFAKNGIFTTVHTKEKMALENITIEQIKEVLLNGTPTLDSSTTNYRQHAWNRKPHYSIFYEPLNLTIVVCESLEKAVLVVSVFHGKAHIMNSNPHNRVY